MIRCPLCPRTHRQVQPDLPIGADWFICGEGPGKTEDMIGLPFRGQAGQELDYTYLPLAGLDRADVAVSNMVQCRSERNGADIKPSPALAHACAVHHLRDEIAQVAPRVIVLMGSTACSLLPGCNLDMEHGFPREATLPTMGWTGTVIPMYHPAAGMHESRFMIYMLDDWARIGLWRRGKWSQPKPKLLGSSYKLVSTKRDLWTSMEDCYDDQRYLAIDTESDEGRPWSIQYSPRPGQAYMLLTANQSLVEDFAYVFYFNWGKKAVFHHAVHDLDVLDQLGIHVTDYRDTIQELFHIGNLPQGLKAAVYRTMGHRMISYDETVTPHSKRALSDWLAEALTWADSQRAVHIQGPCWCGKKHKREHIDAKAHPAEAVLRRAMNGDDATYDPWQPPKYEHGEYKPRLIGRDWLPEIEARIGRMPRQSIVHAPLDEAVRYGCSDADWTGRLAAWLEIERARIVSEEWKVA